MWRKQNLVEIQHEKNKVVFVVDLDLFCVRFRIDAVGKE